MNELMPVMYIFGYQFPSCMRLGTVRDEEDGLNTLLVLSM
jgi:hypothetical protein